MATRNIGLVLDGGGGKGAYQLGVWKALRDTGLDERIAQISGASVGGLNAALMVQGDYDLAEKIWFEEIKSLKPTRIHMWVEDIIKKHLDFSAFSKSEIVCWLATTCISPNIGKIECLEPDERKLCKERAHYFNMSVLNKKDCHKLLTEEVISRAVMLATCALPIICTSKGIDGLWYLDGGLVDNSPVTPIFDVPCYSDKIPKCDIIIVVHLDPVANDYDPGVWDGVTVLQITPNTDVGGFFTGTVNFNPDNARRLAEAGYQDSLPLFRSFLENEEKANFSLLIEKEDKAQKQASQDKTHKALEDIQKFKDRVKEMDASFVNELTYSVIRDQDTRVDWNVFQQMTPEEKYTLKTELSFLLAQNQAKVQYLDVSGFRLIGQLICGKRRKGQRQLMVNNNAIHALLNQLINQIDLELQLFKQEQLKQAEKHNKNLFKILHTQLLLIDVIDKNNSKCDPDQYEQVVQDILDTENDLILELQQEEVFHFQFRILRLVPQEQVVITEHGLVDKMSFTFRRNLDMENNVFDESVFSKIQPLSYQQPFDAIILPYGAYQKHASDITRINTKQRIDFNQYQMRLFMRNHSFLPRQQIVMIDIYDGKSYISGFVVGENNTYTTVFENEEASWYFGPMKRKAEKCFEKNGIEPQSTKFGISSSMIGESWNKWYKNMADIFLLDENQLWQDENAIQCLLNLSTADKM